MDPLSDILNLMQLTGTLYFRTSFSAPWGVAVPSFENVARFHYVHRGRCYARIDGLPDAVLLQQGDLIIVTRGAGHCLSDPSDAEIATLDRVLEDSGFAGRGTLVFGAAGPGHETQLVCGHFAFDAGSQHVLLDSLPPYIRLTDYGGSAPDWLDDTLKLIGGEAGQDRLGADLIAHKLSEIVFAQAIRKYLESQDGDLPGLAGFTDRHLARALAALHANPARNWTVADLAREAGLSRTAFSDRFTKLVTLTPLGYLTQWRMQIARRLLLDSALPIAEIAARSGYGSEAAFSRVFKRAFDMPPAGYRRTHAAV